MEILEYIDDYFKGAFSPEETRQFEAKIVGDKQFAEEVAFYLSVQEAAAQQSAEDKRTRFREIYNEDRSPDTTVIRPARNFWRYAAAAAVIIFVCTGAWLLMRTDSPPQLAQQYIENNFSTLDFTLSTTEDSLQTGIKLYNDNRLSEARQKFEMILLSSPENISAIKYAGIVALKEKKFEDALAYFQQLENLPLFSNPGKFYHAITLMQRNNAGDIEQAKQLLKQVVQDNLEGKETAVKWLKTI